MTDEDERCGMPSAMIALGGIVLLLAVFFVGLAVITNG